MRLSPFCCAFVSAFMVILVADRLPQANAVVDDVLDIIHVVKEISTGILKAWDIVQQTPLGKGVELPLMREKQKKVLQRLKEVSRSIDETEEKNAHLTAMGIESINIFTKENSEFASKMNDISTIMNRILSRYERMRQYKEHQEKLEESTLVAFAEWTVAPNAYSVNYLMDQLHFKLLGPVGKENTSTNLLAKLAENYEETKEQICYSRQSAQQFLYSLYSDIALTELKGYFMMEFSWMILRISGKGNFTQEAELMRIDYKQRTERTLKFLREVMKRSDRIVWRCDPPNLKHEKGKTYDEVTRLIQGFVENEIDMNSEETCRENCGFYQSTKSQGCFKDLYCSRQPKCSGKLYQCTYLDSDMWICPSPLNSTRRYEYIEYENGRILGKKNTCTRGTTQVESWWRYLFWHCSYCFCLCDEPGLKSDRYFNLRESLSDIKNNKIVTGLRFVKHNRVFHIQIQEGQLLPRGLVNRSTLSWKPIDEYQIFDRAVKNRRDFHTMNWENRAIDLDDIVADDYTLVVTGVRFRVVGAHLNLEARLTEIDFEHGQLVAIESNSYWKSNDNTDVSGDRRDKINLNNPDVPTRSLVKAVPTSKHNQYIEFINTSMDKDAAQSTVPFVDVQDVTTDPPVPLSGIGLYHKGRPGYGGFIAPKIITFDFSPFVRVPETIE